MGLDETQGYKPSRESIVAQQLSHPLQTFINLVGSDYVGVDLRGRIGVNMGEGIGPVLLRYSQDPQIAQKIVTLASGVATAIERVQNGDGEEARKSYLYGLHVFDKVIDEDAKKLLALIFVRNIVIGKVYGMRRFDDDQVRGFEMAHIMEGLKHTRAEDGEKDISETSLEVAIEALLTTDILYPSIIPIQ